MVPPLSVTSAWSGMRSITVCGERLSNSRELARSNPAQSRATEITITCNPRHNPKHGMPWSREYPAAATMPSMPRSPKPPGITMASSPRSRSVANRSGTSSASIQSSSTSAPWWKPAWRSASTTDM